MSLEERALRRLLEKAFPPSTAGGQAPADLTCTVHEDAGWYRAYVLDVTLLNGAVHRLFLKDLGTPRGRKGDMVGRRERERCVYERLLRPERDGTARLYGVEWDPDRSRHWLLLEYVEGTPVRQLDLDVWRRAAAWLARFQGSFLASSNRPVPCHLVRHDARFFLDAARGAVEAVSTWSEVEGGRVRALLGGYDQLVSRLLEQGPTLVHGAYLPMQILFAAGDEGERLCPLDWELAALGPPVYDLGFLAYGFEGDQRDSLLAAYTEEAHRAGVHVPADLSSRVACVEVHRTLTALGHSVERSYAEKAIGEYVGILEALIAGMNAGEVV